LKENKKMRINFLKKSKETSEKNSFSNLPKESPFGFVKTFVMALICAAIMRSFFFEPFHIPSGSMKPGLLVGDYIFVAKYSYGYSRYSFPFGISFFNGRIFRHSPKRGDVAVFRLPSDTSINYVKRIIGLPGDRIQMQQGTLFINNKEVLKVADGIFTDDDKEAISEIKKFLETLPEGKIIQTLDQNPASPQDDTGIYEVPPGQYFMMGDNRDNSQDSRFLTQVGYVPEENLIGRATIIFFSNKKPSWQIWNWPNSIRFRRIFTKVK
jgi:signal peptidase I